MKKSTIITLLILLAILLITAYVVYLVLKNKDSRELQTSAAAGVFAQSSTTANFTDFNGNTAQLDQFLGQILIVNSWASWAPSSVTELKLLTQVAKQYDTQGVVVIGINRAESQSTAEAFLATLGLTDDVLLIVDKDDRYYKAIQGYTMPETVVYDTNGDVVTHKRGAMSAAELTVVLNQILSTEERGG